MTRGRRELLLYRSPPHPCSYLAEQTARSAFVDPDAALDPGSYGTLLKLGFRRSGRHVYRPHCPACQACVAARIPVDAFRARRSQRRSQRANRDLALREVEPRLRAEHYALYRAYTAQRHEDGEMARMSPQACQDFLTADWCDSSFLEFRLAGRLVALAATDRVPDGLSAVYTFFDPALPHRSLGSHAILQQIEGARALGLPYLYLGYWIGGCRKMRYKGDYRPLELLQDGAWRRYAAGDPLPADGQAA